MTLVELLIAMAILLMVVATLSGLARTSQQSFSYNEGHGAATQHARVVIERITRTAREATANGQFPGFLVLADEVGAWRFPDTLVVWHPSGSAADPAGLPRFNELVIYCPDLAAPNQLLEITVPDDTRTVPAVGNTAGWSAEISAIRTNRTGTIVVLTDLVRQCSVTGSNSASLRGAVRFETQLRPSDSDWAQYKAGTLPWKQLPWVQGLYGSQTGLRQAWLRLELQLMPGDGVLAEDVANQRAVPFFGSAAKYYQMQQ